MFIRSIVADAFGTNCYVIAPHADGECVIVDPGIGVAGRVATVLEDNRLDPAAVLLTHGHLDHVYAAAAVAGPDVDTYIHAADAYRLQDPIGTLDPMLVQAVEQQLGRSATWTHPDRVVKVEGGERLQLADLDIEVIHAPGHTEGSILLGLPGLPDGIPAGDLDRTLLSGDVLFAGSIGRTDLPGGDHPTMLQTLREVVLRLPDSALVLPGHGPASTVARERATNPFLQGLY